MKKLVIFSIALAIIGCKTTEAPKPDNTSLSALDKKYSNNQACVEKPANYCWYLARNSVKTSKTLAAKLFAHACEKGYSQACLEGYHYIGDAWFKKRACEHGSELACNNQPVNLLSDEDRHLLLMEGKREVFPPKLKNVKQIEGSEDPFTEEFKKNFKSYFIKEINSRTDEIGYCYEAMMLPHSHEQIKLMLKIKFNPYGIVEQVEVSPKDTLDKFKYCVADVAASIRLPHLGLIEIVFYPFVFKTGGE